MARIPTIVARESVLAGAPQSVATGEDFGAGIGRAVQGLGNTIQQIGSEVATIGAQRKAEADRFAVATALSNNTFTETYNDTVNQYPDPTGEGLSSTVMEAHDKWKNDALAASGLTGSALRELDLRLTNEKRMYGEKAANDAATMLGNSADIRVKTGLANVINDVRNHGATGIPEFEAAFTKGADVLQTMPGYDANHKEIGEAQLMSDLAGARFAALADAATTEDGIRSLQSELTADYWQGKFSAAQNEQTRNYLEAAATSIQTESRALVSGTIIQLQDRLNGNVAIPTAEYQAAHQVFVDNAASMTPAQLEAWKTIAIQQSTITGKQGLAPGAVNTTESASALPPGTHSRITYTNQHSIRNRPVAPQLASIYGRAADASGVTEVRVVSGGQARIGSGGKRTGSIRHDEGGAGDIQLVKDGRTLRVDNPNDLPIIIKFLQTSRALGAGGIGAGVAYMGSSTFHVGFGTPAIWGAEGKRANAPAWLVQALEGVTPGTAPASGMVAYRTAIGNIESRGQPAPYQTVTSSGALGRYGIMRANLSEWSTAALGKPVSEAEFLANPDIQDKIFDHRFGMYVSKYGPNLAAAAWFAGEKGMTNNQAMDILGTDVQGYIDKFEIEMAGQTGTTPEGAPGPAVGMTQEDFIRQRTMDNLITDQQAQFNAGKFMDYVQTPNGGGVTVPPLDIYGSDADWVAREGLFNKESQKYDLSEDQKDPLTPGEVKAFTDIMAKANPADKERLMAKLSQWSPDTQRYAYAQLGKMDPTMPIVGEHYAAGRETTARSIVNGQDLITGNPDIKKAWGSEDVIRQNYNAFVGDAASGFNGETQAAMFSAAQAIYADKTRRNPTQSFDQTVFEQSIAEAYGMAVAEVNGMTTFVTPAVAAADPGLVQDWVQSATPDQWIAASLHGTAPIDGNGEPVGANELYRAQLSAVDVDGKYMVAITDGYLLSGTYDANGNPEPYIVQLGDPIALQNDIEDAYTTPTGPAVGAAPVPGFIVDPSLGGTVQPPAPPPPNTDPTAGGVIVQPPMPVPEPPAPGVPPTSAIEQNLRSAKDGMVIREPPSAAKQRKQEVTIQRHIQVYRDRMTRSPTYKWMTPAEIEENVRIYELTLRKRWAENQ